MGGWFGYHPDDSKAPVFMFMDFVGQELRPDTSGLSHLGSMVPRPQLGDSRGKTRQPAMLDIVGSISVI